jgi:ribosomal protein S12 methylthiotransferase accessory factor
MEEIRSFRPVLAGPSVARRGVLTVHAPDGQLVVQASPRYLDALAQWCDGARDVEGIAALSHATWGPSDFPKFLDSLMDAGVLVDPASEALRALQPSARRGTGAGGVPTSNAERPSARGGLTDDHLDALAGLLRAARAQPGSAAEALVGITLVLLQRVGRFAAGVYRVDGAVGLRHQGDPMPGIYRAMPDPLRLLYGPVLIVVSARIRRAGLPAARAALLQAGAIAHLASRWALDRGVPWTGDLPCDQQRVTSSCGLYEEDLVYLGALGANQPTAGSNDTPQLTWVDLPEHRGLAIARAIPPTQPGHRPEFVAWGRSYDAKRALAKALGEYAERKALRRPAHFIEATMAALPGAVHPHALVRYASRQLSTNRLGVAPFDAQQKQRWVQGKEWRTGASVWLPADCVYGASTLTRQGADALLARTTSSGCASDPDLDTAIERAAYELIERDAFARHWLAQAAADRITPASLPARIRVRMEALEAHGCESFVLCMSKGLGPAILVLIRHVQRGFVCAGSACGPDLASSIESAFIEAESAAVVRCVASARPRAVAPRQAASPEDHANLHARRAHFRRADVLLGLAGASIPASAIEWPATLEDRLRSSTDPRPVYWIELPSTNPPCQLDGRPIRTVRVLLPGCIPLAFGFGALPEGMVTHRITAAARFPHPLP